MKPKLILLDIFSYSCMNCMRSLEFIKSLDSAYKGSGLGAVLVHPPEWKFEKNGMNISAAIKRYNIKFPIIIDRNKKIIRKFGINFWPAQILVNGRKIIYRHIGEGSYKNLERLIAKSLGIISKKIFAKEPNYSKYQTVYCGKRKKGRIERLNKNLKFGVVYSDGNCSQKEEFLKLFQDSPVTILAKGKAVNFVAQSFNKRPVSLNIKINNKSKKVLSVGMPRLYKIAKLDKRKKNKLTITPRSDMAVYSFSFQ
ncbi:redoxin domain-containing protein [Candidatus Woesearchaeota archaeon]|nr:redoxin domain-containing protein [Candidatus Woesearchaeota archaeon]